MNNRSDDFNEEAEAFTTEDLHEGEKGDTEGDIHVETLATYDTSSWQSFSRARPVLGRQVMSGSDGAQIDMLKEAIVNQALDVVAYKGIAEDALQQENSIHEQLILIAQERDQANARLSVKHEEKEKLARICMDRGDEIMKLRNKIGELQGQIADLEVGAPLPFNDDIPEPAAVVDVPAAQAVQEEAHAHQGVLQMKAGFWHSQTTILADGPRGFLLAGTDRVRFLYEEGGVQVTTLWSMLLGMPRDSRRFFTMQIAPLVLPLGDEDPAQGDREGDPFRVGVEVLGEVFRYKDDGWEISGDVLTHLTAVSNDRVASTDRGVVLLKKESDS